ncbi:response regulator [Pedobacter caeni]|uniref:Response regulator receiver domain-containing protein n=1 Tax=Pedobacter caeni TaxID=288992 RepID=A0A1M4WUH7_9SPHI|nr:response regulator [Pedobacter caeni]SHE84884.1 Response regulator receiver domain-containing protein [Pedobacter caeni]
MFTQRTSNNSTGSKAPKIGNMPYVDRFLLWNSSKNQRNEYMEIKPDDKKSILIVDDELSILKLLSFILAADYDLIIKKSGIEAIAWLEEGNDPDLIISDLMMPYFDGSTLIRNLKVSGFYRNTPVILLSGAEDLADKVKQMPFKIDSYLEKPFNPAILKSQIAQLIK